MKKLLALVLLSIIFSALQAKKTYISKEKDMKTYLMVFHKDATHGLYMAISRDGYTFTALNNGNPVISGDTIAQ
jgi:hypothetical protein